MKVKVPSDLITIDILTILLGLAIVFIPDNAARIVLGLPFLLFFPGYVLVAALFPRKEGGIDRVERIALSFGMSIAVTALLGLGLNYTPWGIRLFPVLWSITGFILIFSVVTWWRRIQAHSPTKLTAEIILKLPGWEGSALNKALTLILALAIVGAVGTLGYTIAFPKVGEKFSEFYILGNNLKAENYPQVFTMRGNQVISVRYGDSGTPVNSNLGKITLGIINREQQKTDYIVKIMIDGQQVNLDNNGKSVSQLEGIELQQDEKWEQQIGFAPQHIGDAQKVEFLLFKNGATTAQESVHLWVDVKPAS